MRPRITTRSVLLASLLAACGENPDQTPGEAYTLPQGLPVQVWDTMPPEAVYGATAAENVRLTRVELDVVGVPAGWEGATFAVVSDFHLDRWSGNPEVARAALDDAAASGADAVVLLGDYLGEGIDPSPLTALLAPVRGLPLFAVLGDRDVRGDSLAARIERTLTAAGARVLRNEAVPLVIGGDTAFIAGVDAGLAFEPIAEQRYLLGQFTPPAGVALLFSHDAVLAARAPVDRVSAAIAGGVHCGAVDVPGTSQLSWLNAEALPDALVEGTERLYRIGPMVMFVTCGTGYGYIPARFGYPPEAALITLRVTGAADL